MDDKKQNGNGLPKDPLIFELGSIENDFIKVDIRRREIAIACLKVLLPLKESLAQEEYEAFKEALERFEHEQNEYKKEFCYDGREPSLFATSLVADHEDGQADHSANQDYMREVERSMKRCMNPQGDIEEQDVHVEDNFTNAGLEQRQIAIDVLKKATSLSDVLTEDDLYHIQGAIERVQGEIDECQNRTTANKSVPGASPACMEFTPQDEARRKALLSQIKKWPVGFLESLVKCVNEEMVNHAAVA
jgi:hypothetical protein